MAREKFIALDWLRFALAIYLVLFHTVKEYPEIRALPILYSTLSLGFFSTSTFFVLSGFLLAHVYLDSRRPSIDSRTFFIKRFASLYPIHLFALFIAIPLVMTTSANLGEINVTPNTNGWSDQPDLEEQPLGPLGFAANMVLHLTLTHAWNPLYTVFNPPTWSLSALFFFYLTFPFFAPRIARAKRPFVLLACMCTLYSIPAWLVFLSGIDNVVAHGLLHRNPLLRLPEFLAGIILYVIYARHRAWLRQEMRLKHAGPMMAFIAASFAATAYLHGAVGGHWYYLVHNGLLLPAQLMLVLLCACYQPDVKTPMAKLASRLGYASLSIFALHLPLNIVASKLEKLALGLVTIIQQDQPLSALLAVAVQQQRELMHYPVYLLATIVVCILFQEQLVNRARHAVQSRLLPPREHGRASRSSLNASQR